jgi:cell filamentation protein
VPSSLAEVFGKLDREKSLRGLTTDAFAARAAFYYSELNAAHPFPDGNSRTIRKFMQDLAKSAGHDLDWDRVSQTDEQRQALYQARDGAIRGKYGELEEVLKTALQPGNELEHFPYRYTV